MSSRCKTTGKMAYKSKTSSDRALQTVESKRLGYGDGHSYRCPDQPSHWHIGHSDDGPHVERGTGNTSSSPGRWTRVEWDNHSMTLWARTRDTCEWCARPLAGDMVRHHRQRRAVGGDRLANLVGLHDACHRYVHDHPEEARDRGTIVSAHAPDPATVPLTLGDGRTVTLDDAGRYHPAAA